MNQSIKYTYTPLNELTTEQEQYSFYGVVMDVTYPNPDEKNPGDYICSLKVIDETINLKTNPKNFDDVVINVIIKSNSKENMPYIHNVGEILRVHRGYYVN
jgi:hypothetical protein